MDRKSRDKKFYEGLKGKPIGYILKEIARHSEISGDQVTRTNHTKVRTLRDIHTGKIKNIPDGGIIIPGPTPDHNKHIYTIADDFPRDDTNLKEV